MANRSRDANGPRPHSRRLKVGLTEIERAAISEAAARAGLSVSAWAAAILVEAAAEARCGDRAPEETSGAE